MDVFTFIMLVFCVGHCYGLNTQRKRKLDILQLKVGYLNGLAANLRHDIADLQSWRIAIVERPRETGVFDADNKNVDSQLLGRFGQSLNEMDGRVKYIIKALVGEKMFLRELVENIREEIRQKRKTKFNEEKKEREKAIDAKLNPHLLTAESKFREDNAKIEKAFDVKLNQRMNTTESKEAELNEQLIRMSKQLGTSRNNYDQTLWQLNMISKHLDDKAGIVRRRDEQYYTSMKQDGWLKYKHYLYKKFEEAVDFDTAVKRCKYQDATLVKISDTAEHRFLTYNWNNFWVGCTYREDEDEWKWLSGHRMGTWYNYWMPRSLWPNGGTGANCLWLGGNWSKSRFHGDACTSSFHYVCKRR